MDYRRDEAKAAARERFEGLWAALTTPFGADGSVDLAALRADMDHVTDTLGVDGVFCTGVMSEFWALSADERRASVEAVVEAARGRCRVIAHTGHHAAREAIGLTRHAASVGADFAVLINPYYPNADEEGLYAWFAEVCAAVDIGVWMFDTSYSGRRLSLELIERVSRLDNVCGIKVGHGHQRYLEVLDRVGERILVCEPDEGSWLANIRDHGQRVFMSSAHPYLYQTAEWQPMRSYTRLALAGDFERAAEVSATLDPVRELHSRWIHSRWVNDRQVPIGYIKAWAGLLGMSGGPARAPLSPVPAAEVARMAEDLGGTPLRAAVLAGAS